MYPQNLVGQENKMTLLYSYGSNSPSSAVMAMPGVDAAPVPPLVVANTEHSYTVNGVKPVSVVTTIASLFEGMTSNMRDSLQITL